MRSLTRNPLILPVYLPSFLLAFGRGMLIPTLPLYAKSFVLSYGLVGLVLAMQGLGTLVSDVPAGILLGKMGRKPAMLIGVGCVALSVLALFWAQAFPELLFYRFLAGTGNALWNISRHAYITDVTAIHRRGRAIAVFGGIGRIGTFAGPAVGGFLGAAFGLRVAFLFAAGLAAVALLVSALFIEASTPTGYLPEMGIKGHIRLLVKVLKHHYRSFVVAGSAQLFAQMIRAGRHVIVPLYGSDVIGLDVQAVGSIISIAAAVDMSMFYPAGLLMDRFGRKYACIPSFFIQALGMAFIPWSGSFVGLLLATAVLGLGNGIGSGTMMTLGADLAPPDAMGPFLGVWRLIGDGGNSSGPLVVGGTADLVGLPAAALVLAGVGLVSVVLFVLLVPETLKKSAR